MDGAGSCCFHLRVNHCLEVEIRVSFFEIGVQLFIGNLVALFVFAVIGQILLHGVVGEMDAAVADFEGKLNKNSDSAVNIFRKSTSNGNLNFDTTSKSNKDPKVVQRETKSILFLSTLS